MAILSGAGFFLGAGDAAKALRDLGQVIVKLADDTPTIARLLIKTADEHPHLVRLFEESAIVKEALEEALNNPNITKECYEKLAKIAGKSDSGINLLNGLPANQGYNSFKQLKKAIGSPGEGNHWHHIVEQSQIEKSGFSAQRIHNTSNIISIDATTHAKITGYYNTKTFDFTGGLSVRDWLVGQSYEYQYEFGLDVLRKYGVIE